MKSIFPKWAPSQALFSAMLLVAVSWVFVSCGGHDDGDGPHDKPDTKPQKDDPELPISADELSTAAFYIPTDGCYYGYLEFTADGYYLLAPYDFLYPPVDEAKTRGVSIKHGKRHVNRSFSVLRHAKGTRDGEGGNKVFFGRYTQQTPGNFTMNGFGTVVVKKRKSGYKLTFHENGYDAEEAEGRLMEKLASSAELKRLCGTWSLDHVKASIISFLTSETGEELFTKSYKPSEIKYFDEDLYHFLLDHYKEKVEGLSQKEAIEPTAKMGELSKIIFTDNGTFINISSTGDAEPFFWDWQDRGKGVIRWAYLPEELDEDDLVSYLNVFTNNPDWCEGKGLEMIEAYSFQMYDDEVDQLFEWYFQPGK